MFDVVDIREGGKTQHVVLTRNGSHLCTCLLMQNCGIVCAHFFKLMQADRRFLYHVALINQRWVREDYTGDVHHDIERESFLYANVRDAAPNPNPVTRSHLSNFISDVGALFPPLPQRRLSRREMTQKQLYGELLGRFKKAANDPRVCKRLLAAVDKELGEEGNVEGLKDPKRAKTKGRPKGSRFSSCTDPKKRHGGKK